MQQDNRKDLDKTSLPNSENELDSNSTSETNKKSESLKEPPNKLAQFFSKAGYTIWIIVIAVGSIIAFLVSLFLL